MIAGLGLVLALVVTIERFAFGIPAADRPLLMIAALLGVLGVQTVAMGLIGEIIIFTRSEGAADYWIEKTVGKDSPSADDADRRTGATNRGNEKIGVL